MKNLVNTVYILCALIISPIFLNAQEPVADPLSVSCDVSMENAYYADDITWTADVSGGDSEYTYNWSGDISGSGDSVTESFNTAGVIQASIMVADSLGVIESVDCDTVRIIAPLEFVSCRAIETNSNTGYEVEWEAEIVGGIAPYTMTWSGDDGLSGDSDDTSITYTTAGEKTGKVSNISSSDGQVVVGEWDCSPIVTVVEEPSEMIVTCEADNVTSEINSEIVWSANISGGSEPYTIDWSGSDSLSGSDESISKTYNTVGTKTASVNVSSSDAQVAIGVSCGTVEVNEVVEEEDTGSSNNSSGGSSGGRRRSSGSNNNDDNEEENEIVVENTSTTTATTTEIQTVTVASVPVNTQVFANAPATQETNVVVQTEIEDTSNISTTTATSTDLELVSNAGLLAFIGDINLDWLTDYLWLVITLIILGLLTWFLLAWKRRRENKE